MNRRSFLTTPQRGRSPAPVFAGRPSHRRSTMTPSAGSRRRGLSPSDLRGDEDGQLHDGRARPSPLRLAGHPQVGRMGRLEDEGVGADGRGAGAVADRSHRNQQWLPARLAEFEILSPRRRAQRLPHHRHVDRLDAGHQRAGARRVRAGDRDGRERRCARNRPASCGQMGARPDADRHARPVGSGGAPLHRRAARPDGDAGARAGVRHAEQQPAATARRRPGRTGPAAAVQPQQLLPRRRRARRLLRPTRARASSTSSAAAARMRRTSRSRASTSWRSTMDGSRAPSAQGQNVTIEADIRNDWFDKPEMFNVVGEIRGTSGRTRSSSSAAISTRSTHPPAPRTMAGPARAPSKRCAC